MFLLVSSLLPVFNQLIFSPYFSAVIGYSPKIEFIVISAVFIGFTLGLTLKTNSFWLKPILVFCSLSELIIGIFYSKILLLGVGSIGIKIFLFTLGFLVTVVAGVCTMQALSVDSKDRLKKYSWMNLFSALIVLLFIFLQVKVPLPIFHIVNALLLAGIAFYFFKNKKNLINETNLFQNFQTDTFILGTLSGLYVVLIVKILGLYSQPNGTEFYSYLFFTFLFLWIASKIHLRNNSTISKVFHASHIPLISLSFLILAFILIRMTESRHFSATLFSLAGPDTYFVYKIITSFALMFPYLFFSMSFAVQQKKHDHHVLAYLTIGNFTGFIFGAFCCLALGAKALFLVFAISCFGYYLTEFKVPKVFVGVVLALFLTNKHLEEKIITAGIKNYSRVFYISPFMRELAYSNKTKDSFKIIEDLGMDTGFLFTFGNNFDLLGLNGHVINQFSMIDYIRTSSLTSKTLQNAKKIAILGLGNHQLLKKLDSLSLPDRSVQVDVIDNFPLFNKTSFKDLIAKEAGFDWSGSNIQFHYDDVFQFLSQSSDGFYDLVIWNLTDPNFGSSNYLYTKEFGQLINRKLSSEGSFMYLTSRNRSVDCTFTNQFKYAEFYPATSKYPFILMRKNNNTDTPFDISAIKLDEAWCDHQETYSIAKPFSLASHKFRDFRDPDWNERFNELKTRQMVEVKSDPQNIASWIPPFNAPADRQNETLFLSLPLTGEFKSWGQSVHAAIELYRRKESASSITYIDNYSNPHVNAKQNAHFALGITSLPTMMATLDNSESILPLGDSPLLSRLNRVQYARIYPHEKIYDPQLVFDKAYVDSSFAFANEFAKYMQIKNIFSIEDIKKEDINERTLIFLSTKEQIKNLQLNAIAKLRPTFFLNPTVPFNEFDLAELGASRYLTVWHQDQNQENCDFYKDYLKAHKQQPSPLTALSYGFIEKMLKGLKPQLKLLTLENKRGLHLIGPEKIKCLR